MIDPVVVEELIDRALYARKTAPSLSALEKHAAQSGGGVTGWLHLPHPASPGRSRAGGAPTGA